MNANQYLKIGVMGGMGPETSAAFYSNIISLFQTERKARHNFEFPEMLIHNVPSPDNVEAGVNQELLPYMLASVALLEEAGMDFITIPCNSAHVHIDAIQQSAKIPVMNILEETAKVVASSTVTTVLVLGTKSTLGYGLYPPYLAKYGLTSLVPSAAHQDALTEMIMQVCDGTVNAQTRTRMLTLIAAYPQAQGVVLGCTEIPLIVGQKDMDLPCFDTAEILTRATFDRCVAGT